ncbi:hypothetical protein QR680_007391 [Steinernema hermaphroditum]|nr:hypothetical protein QR680_007391 [Steinernema hermaphroditum]
MDSLPYDFLDRLADLCPENQFLMLPVSEVPRWIPPFSRKIFDVELRLYYDQSADGRKTLFQDGRFALRFNEVHRRKSNTLLVNATLADLNYVDEHLLKFRNFRIRHVPYHSGADRADTNMLECVTDRLLDDPVLTIQGAEDVLGEVRLPDALKTLKFAELEILGVADVECQHVLVHQASQNASLKKITIEGQKALHRDAQKALLDFITKPGPKTVVLSECYLCTKRYRGIGTFIHKWIEDPSFEATFHISHVNDNRLQNCLRQKLHFLGGQPSNFWCGRVQYNQPQVCVVANVVGGASDLHVHITFTSYRDFLSQQQLEILRTTQQPWPALQNGTPASGVRKNGC